MTKPELEIEITIKTKQGKEFMFNTAYTHFLDLENKRTIIEMELKEFRNKINHLSMIKSEDIKP